MKNLDDILDAVRTITGSDYRTAAVLGVERMIVSGWRSRKSMPNNKHLMMMVDMAKLDLRQAIEAVEYSREFERPMKQAGFATVSITGFISGVSLTFVTGYALYPSIGAAFGAGTLYIM